MRVFALLICIVLFAAGCENTARNTEPSNQPAATSQVEPTKDGVDNDKDGPIDEPDEALAN